MLVWNAMEAEVTKSQFQKRDCVRQSDLGPGESNPSFSSLLTLSSVFHCELEGPQCYVVLTPLCLDICSQMVAYRGTSQACAYRLFIGIRDGL